VACGPAWRRSPCLPPRDALISPLHTSGGAHPHVREYWRNMLARDLMEPIDEPSRVASRLLTAQWWADSSRRDRCQQHQRI
jgi:hypothetical protein